MAARIAPRVLGLVPGAAGIRTALAEFKLGGRGTVTALNTNLLRCAADLVGEGDEDLRTLAFGDLVKECTELCDEQPKAQVSRALFVAAIARACEDIDGDSPLARSARYAGFHRALADTLLELYAWGISGEDLAAAADQADEIQAAKWRSIAGIERDASEILSGLGYETGSSSMARCIECKPGKGSKLPRVLVLAGSEVDPMAARFLRWLAANGPGVDIVVDRALPDQKLFAGADAFAPLIDEGQPQLNDRAIATDRGLLCDALFSSRKATGKPSVRINSCADALAEAEWTLRSCLGDRLSGLLPHEIAIYARDIEEYACPLEAAAKRLGVPLRMSRRVPVLTNRFARLVLETLDFCASEDPRKIIPILACSYLGLDRQTASEIGAEARLAYKSRANAWPLFTGFAEKRSSDIPWLARLLLWREEAMRQSQSLRGWSGRLQVLTDILPWHGSSSDGPTKARDTRIPSALRRAIRNIASVRAADDERAVSLREFAKICREIWSDEEYFIPSSGPGIAVLSNAQSFGEVRSIYALGMLEGVFPRRRREDPILTDEDRKELSRLLNLPLPLTTSFETASRERDEFYRLCAAAQDSLTLSYPQTDENRDNVPAFYLQEVERVAGPVAKHDYPRVPFAPSKDDSIAIGDRMLRESLDGPREDPLPVTLSTAAVRAAFSWPEENAFSPQDLREALRCEFRHFASKRIGLRPNRESSRWTRLQGMPRSVRLLQQPDANAAKHALEVALDAELDQVYGEIPDWELALMRSGGRRLIAEWVQREFASRMIWPKETETLKVDIPFGAPGVRNRMPGDVPLEGHVAGVSRMGPYAVTHLYESQAPATGNSIEGGSLAELDVLYYGLHLLARFNPGQPTAVEVESMHGSRTLLVLPRVAEMPLPSRVQDGLRVVDLTGGGDGPLGQKAFFDEVKRRLKRAVQRLRQSGVQPMPGEHCTWCGYGELCRRSSDFSEDDTLFGMDENELNED